MIEIIFGLFQMWKLELAFLLGVIVGLILLDHSITRRGPDLYDD